jgi:hypothetical protein
VEARSRDAGHRLVAGTDYPATYRDFVEAGTRPHRGPRVSARANADNLFFAVLRVAWPMLHRYRVAMVRSDPDIAARSVDGCPSAASAPVVAAMIAQTPTPSRTTSPTSSKVS